jgi:hypothetical protein
MLLNRIDALSGDPMRDEDRLVCYQRLLEEPSAATLVWSLRSARLRSSDMFRCPVSAAQMTLRVSCVLPPTIVAPCSSSIFLMWNAHDHSACQRCLFDKNCPA